MDIPKPHGITSPGLKVKPVTDEELMKMQSGARIKGLLPEIEQTISDQQRRVTTQAQIAVQKGTLTPEMAVSLWHEYVALTNVLRGMENKARIGEAAGQKLAAQVNE